MAQYIDNKKFFEALVERHEQVVAAAAAGEEKPRVSEYLGKCILDIATYLYYKPNFLKMVLYREEMVLDGVEAGLRAIDKFDVSRNSSPFSYFTQVIYYAYIHRISKEKRHYDTKKRYILTMLDDEFATQQQDDDGNFDNGYVKWVRENIDASSLGLDEPKKSVDAAPEGIEHFLE